MRSMDTVDSGEESNKTSMRLVETPKRSPAESFDGSLILDSAILGHHHLRDSRKLTNL